MVLSLMPIAAEAGHRHCICGEADCTEHGGEQAWEPLPADGVPTTPGTYYYYLTEDTAQELTVTDNVTLNLCFNGHTLTYSPERTFPIDVNYGGAINICDCSAEGTGRVDGLYIRFYGTNANIYGGTMSIYAYVSDINIYGGTLDGSKINGYNSRVLSVVNCNVMISGAEIINAPYDYHAIYSNASTFTISDTVIRDNGTQSSDCGGIRAMNSSFVLNRVTFDNNASNRNFGSAIHSNSSDIVANDCVIKNNLQAGVYLDSGSTFIMNGGSIESHDVKGVYLDGQSKFTLNSGKISENDIGVHVSSGSFTMTGGEISSNNDGVNIGNGTFKLTDGSIKENRAKGVTLSGGSFVMTGGTIAGNNDHGVHMTEGKFKMCGGRISGNRTNGNGGGVLADYRSVFEMTGGEICENTAQGNGGGVSCNSGVGGSNGTNSTGGIEMTGGRISNNIANGNGGGISGCIRELSGGEISENKATNGGGLYGAYTLDRNITNCLIANNTATENGGAILTEGNQQVYVGANTHIIGNSAKNGGGVYVVGTSVPGKHPTVLLVRDGALISGNTAIERGGGIFSNDLPNSEGPSNFITLNNGKVVGNSAGTLGGGIYFAGTELNISGASAVGGNLANGVADDIYLPEGKKIRVIGELDNASVGIRMENPDTFTNNYSVLCGTADPASFFVSNDIQKTVALTPDNAEARLIDGHTHGDWSYTANGATLTATCGSDSYSETLTVSAQSEYVYDGTAKTASLSEQGGMLSDLRVALITYNTEDGKAPTAPGEYTASITVGGATASVSFEITIDGVDAPTPTQTEYFYTGEAQSCFNIPEDALYTATGNTQTEVGEYIVTLSLKDKEHLVWNDSGNTDDKVYTFVIKKAAVQEPSAPTSEIVYNGAPQSYFGNIDTSLYTAINNTQTNAGSYTVTLSLKDKTNRVWSSSGSNADLKFTFNIAKAPLSIAVKDQTVQINDSISSTLDDVTLSDPAQLMGGDALHGVTLTGDTSTATNIGHISLGAVVIKNGETDVTGNYKLESTNGNLTVLPEALPSTKTLTGIIVTRVPDKTAYNVGDSFNPAGMVVTATYSVVSGEQTFTTSDTVTTYTVTDGSNLPVGKAFVTIRYTENGVTKETTQAIHIHGNAESVSKTPATCTADGEMAHYLCGCGVRFLDENCTQPVRSADDLVIGKAPHSDENNDGKCDNCQADLGGEEPQKSCRDKFLDFMDSANRAIVEFFNKIRDFFRNLFKVMFKH